MYELQNKVGHVVQKKANINRLKIYTRKRQRKVELHWGLRKTGEVGRKPKGDTIDTEELKSLRQTKLDEPIVIGSTVGDMQNIKTWIAVGNVQLYID